MEWRNDKATKAQIRAIRNIGNGFCLAFNADVNSKGQAYDEIQRLIALVKARKETARVFRSNNYELINDIHAHYDLALCGQ